MKKLNYLLALLFGLSIIACSDLEEDAISLLEPDERVVDLATVETTVAGAYSNLAARAFLSRALGLTLMLRSDMVAIGNPSTAAERIEHDQFTVSTTNPLILNPSNPERSFWPRLYQMVRGANETLREIEVLEEQPPGVTEELAARARFIRGFSYYHLVRLFGEIPYLDETTTTIEASVMERTSVDIVYDNIIADFKYAKEWLPNSRANRALPSKASAGAYLASVYLTRGMYQQAYDESTEIINNSATYDLALEPDFADLFDAELTDLSKEPIFVIDFVGTNINDESRDYLAAFTGFFGQATYYPSGGWSVMVPAQDVFDTWQDGDYRKEVSFDDTAITNSGEVISYPNFSSLDGRNANRPHIAKYTAMAGSLPQANTSGRDSESNYYMMRFAEVYLIAAEAAVELGLKDQADTYVNIVRERARNGNGDGDPSAVPADISGATVADVLEERRLELAFEHKRWYDIVRRRLGPEVFGPNGLEADLPGARAFDPTRDYLLPIPPLEITNNPNLTQNPGY
ncbi:tetratricopeptide (TPR) repeat protein [Lewinella marina]|uniref:RagB/SusD family nutrient uptake outer membrane protein n=1 Tax=Neolewinella marina TaxID=438751 RepID=A0A2G0CBL2_9BACT|nr:RagB/SusD family nutrient uptake outer membrane protein [Neolewinella marina]NJB87108.1 tetratricopeptide (TPR) repeat protein [Neolewinella marina]PHK97363.1 RagB/SusD family nutrient uptake outer membrane protein [Neolewinella marina]